MVITSNCNNMGNTKKVVIHISKFRGGQYLFLFYMRYCFKISLICRKLFKYKRIWLCQKNPKMLKKCMLVSFSYWQLYSIIWQYILTFNCVRKNLYNLLSKIHPIFTYQIDKKLNFNKEESN